MNKPKNRIMHILISLFHECNLKYKVMVTTLAFMYYTTLCQLLFGEALDTIRSMNVSIITTFVFLYVIVRDMLKE